MKHAYCIIAHNEPLILQKLIEAIDDERNDIFLLIDKKTEQAIFKGIKTNKSKLVFVPRIDIRWGDISLIKAELTLLEIASQQNAYQYYHLLSGVDLPIKSQDYIHNFMNEHNGKEFVGYAQGECNVHDLRHKTRHYYILTRYYRSSLPIRFLCKIIRSSLLFLQKIIKYERHFNIELKKGVNWISITHKFCIYLIERKKLILNTFKYTLCSDEMFVQTILYQSPYRKNIYKPNYDFDSCLREIDWQRGSPYTWGSNPKDINNDIMILKNSEKLFARKFSSKNMDFINEILKLSQNQQD